MRITRKLIPFLGLAVVVACGEAPGHNEARSPQAASSGTLDPAQAGQLPPGHPPMNESSAGMAVAQPPGGSGIGESGMVWDVPEGWTSVPPSSAMRRAQYVVSGEGGDAECVAYYFGPGQGGDAQANALRWADQFSQPDGSSSRDVMQTRQIKIDGFEVLMVDVSGTYSGGMTMMGDPNQSLADYRLLGAIAEGPDANWFFKLTGPGSTVAAHEQAFEAMIRSLRRGGSV